MSHAAQLLRQEPLGLIFLAVLALLPIAVTVAAHGYGMGLISTGVVRTLGKTLTLALIAVAMDLIRGCAGVLRFGHFAFFGLGGDMIGMWLMYERTRQIVALASIYLAVRVAIGGRGRLNGAVFVSLVSTWVTGGQVPDVNLGFCAASRVDRGTILLGLSFASVTLFAPQGIGGLFGIFTGRQTPDRHGADPGPDLGSLRETEADE